MDSKVSKKIYYMYFMLSVFIIGIHSTSMVAFNISGGDLLKIHELIMVLFDSATGTFFFMSAFMLYRSKAAKEHRYIDIIKKKAKAIVIPYFVWNAVVFIYTIIKDYYLHQQIPVLTLNNLISQIILSKANSPLWFLRVLFELILLFPVIKLIIKNRKIALIVIGGLIIANCIIGPDTGYSTARFWLPMYLIGAFIASEFEEKLYSFKISNQYIELIIIMLLFMVSILLADKSRYIYYLYRFISPFYIWIICNCFKRFPEPKWWVRNSFFLYCTHIMVVSPIQKIYVKLFGDSDVSVVLSHLIIPCLCVCVLIFVATIFRKALPKIWNFMTGER